MSCLSSSSPIVAGWRGNFANTHCTGAKPPCLDSSLMAVMHSVSAMSISALPVALVSRTTLLSILLRVSFRLSTLPICSGDSSAAGFIRTPFLLRVCANTPLLWVPLSAATNFGQPNGLTHPFTKASRQLDDEGTPFVSASLTTNACCSVVP